MGCVSCLSLLEGDNGGSLWLVVGHRSWDAELELLGDGAEEGTISSDGLEREEEDEAEGNLGQDIQDSVDDDLLVGGGDVTTLRGSPEDDVAEVEKARHQGEQVVELGDLTVGLGGAAEAKEELVGNDQEDTYGEGVDWPCGVVTSGEGSGKASSDTSDGEDSNEGNLNPVGAGEQAQGDQGQWTSDGPLGVADPLEGSSGAVLAGHGVAAILSVVDDVVIAGVSEGLDEVGQGRDGVDLHGHKLVTS